MYGEMNELPLHPLHGWRGSDEDQDTVLLMRSFLFQPGLYLVNRCGEELSDYKLMSNNAF